jgi:hypothetical protein
MTFSSQSGSIFSLDSKLYTVFLCRGYGTIEQLAVQLGGCPVLMTGNLGDWKESEDEPAMACLGLRICNEGSRNPFLWPPLSSNADSKSFRLDVKSSERRPSDGYLQ